MSKYTEQDLAFSDLILERGNFRVTWEWIGEGWSGDYNEDDPEDTPLLRFSVDERVNYEGGIREWEGLEDASYCTRMPIDSPLRHLVIAAGILLEVAEDSVNKSVKKRFEELSWFCPDDFQTNGA